MCFCPRPAYATVPMCFPYNHSPIAHSPWISCLAVAAWFPTNPSASSLLLPLSFPSAFYTISLFHSLQQSSPLCTKAEHTGVFPHRSISSLDLCACIQVGWLLGRENKLLCKLCALQTCKGTQYFEIPCWFTKMYWILPKVSKFCNSNSLVIQSPLCLETIHPMTDSYMSVMQRQWTRFQPKSSAKPASSKFTINQGR